MDSKRATSGTFSGLMRAAAFGQIETVRELLKNDEDVNNRGPRGATALMFAASGGHIEIVQELVEHGADVEAEEDGGWTARRHAEEDGYQDVSDFLVFIEEGMARKVGNA